jgi:hypothetical protein
MKLWVNRPQYVWKEIREKRTETNYESTPKRWPFQAKLGRALPRLV